MITRKHPSLQPYYWGLLHGVNDLAAGFLLAGYTLTHNYSNSFLFISVYAILGFGGQLPAGFWLDQKKNIPFFANLSLFLLPLALACYFISPELAIIVSGLASAFVHVTGGTICLQVHDGKAGPLGVFTAPGVLGLTIGGLLGSSGALLPVILLGASVLTAVFIIRTPLPAYQSPEKKQSELDKHDLLMLLILLLMCFRSFVFDVLNYVAVHYEDGVLYIGISAFAGKIAGGFLADRVGARRFIYISLCMALVFFQLGKENIYLLCAGVACLQSSVPLTLLLMARCLPFYPAAATAFSLGIPVALAGLPLYLVTDKELLQEKFGQPLLSIVIFLLLLALWIFLEKKLVKHKIL